MKKLWFALGATVVLFVAGAVGGYLAHSREAAASRNASGTYSTPNTFVTGTVISSTAVNANFSDIATEMTDSLDRSGKGGMLAALRGIDGTVAAPAFSWTSETGTGLYRIGSSDVGFAISGTKKLELTGSLFTIVPNVSLTGFISSAVGIGVASPHSTSPLFVIGAGSSFATVSRGGTNLRLGANTYFDGSADKYNATGFAGILEMGGLTSADFRFYTAPSGTGGNSATFTERLKVNEAGTTFSTGVGADGSGFKHKRGVSGCTTAAAAGATCSSTVTWGTAFADANYTATCNVNGSSGPVAYVGISSKIAASLSVAITAVTANAATATTFECIAVHD